MMKIAKIVGALLLAVSIAAPAQESTPKRTPPAKHKTQEQILLEELNERFEAVEKLTEQVQTLTERLDTVEKKLATRDAELEQARKDAVAAQATAADVKQKMEATQQAVGPEGSSVTALQHDVADLKATSSSLTNAVAVEQQEAHKLENPDIIRIKGVELKLAGFVAAETVDRQRAIGGDVNTQFSGIPFANSTAGVLSEFNASGRQSRLSLMAESKLPSATLRAYFETDFLSAGTTSNDNQSNSYTLRLRQAWAQAALTADGLSPVDRCGPSRRNTSPVSPIIRKPFRSPSTRSTTSALHGNANTASVL